MSDVIQLLPDAVANQIAAGEVIQRPASVVKELVENSIDAGATRVQVIITDAGKTSIQVIDNGKGMSATDARLSFERHATSKITTAHDLFALTTMGFRGEALASIAAVAQVELRTRMEQDELGTSLYIEGAKYIGQEAVLCPVGANFVVKNLFFNVPARRKFLKSDQTEFSNIVTEFERIALAHPEISFALSTPENVILDLPIGNFKQRVVNIFGRKIEKKILPVQVQTDLVQIAGFVGTPESSKRKGAQQFFFVNGRFMRHPYFAKALHNAFERFIPEGEQVPFFLQLLIDPAKIDVNIHPTKTEIKFLEEQSIWQILHAAVREALARFNAIPTIDFDNVDKPNIPVFVKQQGNFPPPPSLGVDPSYNPFHENSQETAPFLAEETTNDKEITLHIPQEVDSQTIFSAAFAQTKERVQSKQRMGNTAIVAQDEQWEQFFAADAFSQDVKPQNQAKAVSVQNDATLYQELSNGEQEGWTQQTQHFLSYRERYLLTVVEEGLLLIDQRRAHVRIRYDEYMKRAKEHKQHSQGLLFPQIIELTTVQTALLQSLEEELNNLGFDLSYLGGGSFSILGVPMGLELQNPVELLQYLLDEISERPTNVREELLSIIALNIAKKTALTAAVVQTVEESRDLVKQLFQTQNPTYTPEGKIIITTLPHSTILKSFD